MLCVNGTERANGENAEPGSPFSAPPACSMRALDELAGFHGNVVSLQRVAV